MSYGAQEYIQNVILADQLNNTILASQLDATRINVIHVTVLNAVVTLPATITDYRIEVTDAVSGGGNITVNQAV
ncbi:MAG: hypothetical protein KUG64_10180 [Cycloclasticus sp.]|nr:hypothetical protein [Cycloclasticus sp.]